MSDAGISGFQPGSSGLLRMEISLITHRNNPKSRHFICAISAKAGITYLIRRFVRVAIAGPAPDVASCFAAASMHSTASFRKAR
jgi:hypothetical protein